MEQSELAGNWQKEIGGMNINIIPQNESSVFDLTDSQFCGATSFSYN
jgi:predicted secreted protein